MLVPETPEDHGPASKTFKRRRSSRRSTLKTDHVLNRVLETPETALVTSSRGRTRVEESPDDAGSSRGRDSYLIHDPDPSVAPHPPASSRPHPLFSHPRQDPLLESEDTFVQYVAATQDLASTRMEDKVNQWLMQNEEREQNKKSRRSAIKSGKNSGGTRPLANDLCQMLLHKENQSASSPVAESDGASQARLTPPAPTTRKKPNRRRSSLLGPPLDHSLISSLPDTTARRTSFFRSPLTARKVGKDASASLESGLRPSLGPVKALDLQDSSEDEVFIAKAPTPATVAPTTPTPPQVSLSSMASSSSCLAPGVAVPDFSTDSAKALMQHYEDEKLKSESEKVAAEADTEEEEEQQEAGAELPPLDSVLKEVVAYVEVRTKHENRSKGVQDALVSLGAKISPKIGPDVTHFIFKDGSLSAYNKAKKLNIHIVSVTWIEACRKDRTKASESLFPTTSKHKYDSPGLFPKLRKVKSMQPKTDEELAKITDAKSKARIKKAETDKMNSSTTKEKSFARPKPKFPIGQIPLDFYNSPRAHLAKNVSPPKMDKDSIMNVLNEIGSPIHTPKSQRLPNSSIELSPCNSEDFNTPLARRLANKYYQPSSGGTIAPTTPGSQLSKVVPSRRLSEDMSLTLMGPPESPLVRNGTGGLKFKKVTSAANESLLSGIAELEAEQDAEEEEEEEERVELDKAKRLHKNKANKTKRSREESSEDKDEVALLAVNGGETTPKVKEASSIRKRKSSEKAEAAREEPCCEQQSSQIPSGVHKSDRQEQAAKRSGEEEGGKKLPKKKAAGPKRRHMLFSQNLDGPLSVTATHTPLKSEIVPIENVHLDASETQYKNEIPVKKARTKLVKNKNSGEVVAEPPTQVPRKNQIDGKKKKKKERPKISQTSQNTSSSSSVASIVSGIGMRRIIPPRRSTLDFRTSNEIKKTVRDQKEIWTEIVCTSCSTQDVNLIKQLIKKFTAAKTYPQLKLAKNISNKTTHVVCGEPNKRTLNVLRGILRGCWILTKDWLEASSEAGRWEDEEDYEMITFSSAVKACRREREAFGLDFYRCDLFRDCGSIYVSRQCKAPAKELSELIRLAGGKPVNVARVADIVVGVGDVDTADMCVGEKWILDSIQRMKVMDLKEYAIH